MSAKAGTKKGPKTVTNTEPVKEEVVIESVKEKPIVVPEEETLSITNDDNNEEYDEINSEEIVSSEKYIDIIKQKNLLIQEEAKALSSISSYTKAELMKIEKEELINAKAKFDLEKKQIKEKYSRLKKNAPKGKKNKLDENGNKIITPGKSPCIWYDFAVNDFGLESNEGHSSTFLTLMWPFLKSEEGVKNGSSIIISKPGGRVNKFFNEIKRVMEERGLNTEKEKEVYALIEKGVLVNTDITKFSKYCYEEKEKKPKATKKSDTV